MKWISVKNRLPEISTAMKMHQVLVWVDEPFFYENKSNRQLGYLYGDRWRIQGSPSDWKVSHWTSLPKPPKARN